MSIESLASTIVQGGWPASIDDKESSALRHVADYVETVIDADISRVDDVDKNPVRVRAVMRLTLSRLLEDFQYLAFSFNLYLPWICESTRKPSIDRSSTTVTQAH